MTLQVNVAPAKLKAAEVVHLSLDDSKAEKTSSKNDATTQVNETNVATNDKQSNATNRSDTKPADQTTAPVNETQTDVTSTSVAADNPTEDKAENISQPSVAKESQATESSATTAQEPVAAKADASESAVVEVEATDIQSAADATVSTDISNKDESATLTLTHDALFAERYVTAEKFGQASNDPRVVRQQQATSTAAVSVQANTNVPTIRGTVGAFIRAALADAESRLQTDGVISCFIEAIEAHSQQAKAANATPTADNNGDNSDFDFSNYGYEPLSADYVARFDAMTQAVSQFALAQGKTEVEPRAISKRASNDPRGQHPDYQEVAVLSVARAQTEEQPSEESQQQVDLASEAESSEAKSNEQSETIVNDVDDASAAEMQIAATQDSGQVDADEVEADALSSQQQADNISSDSEQLLQMKQTSIDESAKEEDQTGKSKTTIASYKNMIENVAEQLLPQTGMFSLTTPKVPKARSRKPKAEHKKPSQAEKSESESSDSDS